MWFCYGDQNIGRLSYVSCEQSTMCTIEFKVRYFSGRVTKFVNRSFLLSECSFSVLVNLKDENIAFSVDFVCMVLSHNGQSRMTTILYSAIDNRHWCPTLVVLTLIFCIQSKINCNFKLFIHKPLLLWMPLQLHSKLKKPL